MKITHLLVSALAAGASTVYADYVVQLKDKLGLNQLLDQDDHSTVLHHIRPYIKNTISFPGFNSITGNFTYEMVQRLKRSPFVKAVVPDLVINAALCNSTSSHLDSEKSADGIIMSTSESLLGIFERYPEMKAESLGPRDIINTNPSDGTASVQLVESTIDTQYNSSRHLARVSRNSKLPINASVNYYHDSRFQGEGVFVYIVDTGVNKDHPEFEGRAIFGADFTSEGGGDQNNHGSHVAGIVGSKSYGVAKKVTLVEVKALDKLGQGSLSTVLEALEFTVNDRRNRGVPGVVNLSLGSSRNLVLNQAIEAAFDSGLVVVVAAGNANIDACLTSPASSPHAITVGAISDKSDSIADFSNWGSCLDVFASGIQIESVNAFDYHQSLIHSGTSMAAPSVTGIVAILLEKGIPVGEISRQIEQISTKGRINKNSKRFKPSTPDRIANNGIQREDDYYPEEAPIVDDVSQEFGGGCNRLGKLKAKCDDNIERELLTPQIVD